MSQPNITLQLDRIFHLIKLLSTESLSGPQIVARLHGCYERSGTRLLRTDLAQLKLWNFDIKTRRNPARYELVFNPLAHSFSHGHLEALAMVREMFSAEHPLAGSFHPLLSLLTLGLDDEQRAVYEQPPTLRLSLKLATDYPAIHQFLPTLKFAIIRQHQVQFEYLSLDQRDQPVRHIVDPFEIEYQQQHLYLVAYSNRIRQIMDFRLDQIVPNSVKSLPTPIANPNRDLHPYVFRYRLVAKLARRGVSERFVQQRIVQTFANGDVEIEARARSQFYALRGLLRYATSARATFPPALVEEMKTTLHQMIEQYAD